MYIGHIIMKIKDIANKWLSFHERQGKFSNFAAGFFFAVLVGVLEHFAGKDFSLAIFYLLPTAFTAWFAGRAGGIVISRAFNETAQVEIARMTRDQTPLTIVYMDLDNFKAINDGYGHTTGDLLLQTVAE